ncbi:ATP-binding protein [Neisseriaceae bacterium TC5R-5]|nr:ATP-binding protein [Neisseriaceae bacterium TC5R-5]
MSLRLKTILGIMLIEALSILLYFALSVIYDSSFQELIKRTQEQASLLAYASQGALNNNDLVALQQLADKTIASQDIVLVRIDDPKNKPVVQADNRVIAAENMTLQEKMFNSSTADIYRAQRAVIVDGKLLGYVVIGASLTPYQTVMDYLRHYSVILVLGKVLLSILFSALLANYLVRQLKSLQQATQVMSTGAVGYQIPLSGSDEFTSTRASFNLMSEKLKESYTQLKQALNKSEHNAATLLLREQELLIKQKMLDAINQLQYLYISNKESLVLFEYARDVVLDISGAHYGLFAEVIYEVNGKLQLHILGLSDIDVEKAGSELFKKYQVDGAALLASLSNLSKSSVLQRQPVIYNQPVTDLPAGSPPLTNYLGMPIIIGDNVVGVIVLSNHPFGFSQQHIELFKPLLNTCGQLIIASRGRRELEQTRQALANSESQLRNIVDTSFDGIITTKEGVINSANQAAELIFQIPSGQLQGREVLSLLTEESLPDYQWLCNAQLSTDQILGKQADVLGKRADGSLFPMELAVTEMVLGERLCFNLVVRDISKRKLAEAQIESLVRELEASRDLSPNGFVAFDCHERLRLINPAMLNILGKSASEATMLTLPDFDFLLSSMSQNSEQYRAIKDLKDGEFDLLNLHYPQKQTLKRFLRIQYSDDGVCDGYLIYFRDITQEANLDKMRTQFLSTAAHELRTPTASIVGYSELLSKHEFSEDARSEIVNTIYRQSCNLASLINELLDLARLEARANQDFVYVSKNLSVLVQELLEKWPTPLGRMSPKLLNEIDGMGVVVDQDKFKIAFNNVLSNAYKYSDNQQEVTVELLTRIHEGIQQYGVRIHDRGIGIPEHLHGRVFDPFFRVDASSSRSLGNGLGLSLVKEIMSLLNGQVEIFSRPGKGTQLTLWLLADNHFVEYMEGYLQ